MYHQVVVGSQIKLSSWKLLFLTIPPLRQCSFLFCGCKTLTLWYYSVMTCSLENDEKQIVNSVLQLISIPLVICNAPNSLSPFFADTICQRFWWWTIICTWKLTIKVAHCESILITIRKHIVYLLLWISSNIHQEIHYAVTVVNELYSVFAQVIISEFFFQTLYYWNVFVFHILQCNYFIH